MRHGKKFNKLGLPRSHRVAMLRNLVTSLFQHKEIKTISSRAKEARKIADRMVRYSISGTLADKRRIIEYLKSRDVAHELIKLGKDVFSKREKGGYTAIYHLGHRAGDGAEMALLKLIMEARVKKGRKPKAAETTVIEAVEAPAEKPKVARKKAAEKKAAEEAATEAIEETETQDEKSAPKKASAKKAAKSDEADDVAESEKEPKTE